MSVPLILACPTGTCGRKEHSWAHAPDDGALSIDRRAHVRCATCAVDRFVLEWRWRCDDAAHGGEFEKTTVANMAAVLSDTQRYQGIEGGVFYCELMRNLVLGSTR